jgi:general secretion pathway protein K
MKRSDEKGIALIITLLVVTLLTALIVEFAYSARVNLSSAGGFRDRQKAYYLAKSGANFIGGMLKDNASRNKADDINQMIPPVTVGDGVVSLKVFDELAKINIKKIKDNTTAQKRLERLFEILNISVSLFDAIKEREGEYNLLSELRLVRGMTDDVYNKIKDYLTVYGDGNININTADVIVLRCLSADITEDIARRIISYREKNRFENSADLKKVVGVSQDFNISDIATKSDYFSVISSGTVNDVKSTITAVLKRSGGSAITRFYWRNE